MAFQQSGSEGESGDKLSKRTDSDAIPLFRPESAGGNGGTEFGRPAATFPLSWTMLALLLVGMVGVSIIVLATGTYSRTETAVGIVQSAGTNARVSAPTSGTITSLRVTEGQHVRAGQPLAIVSTDRIGLNGVSIDGELITNLDLEVKSLEDRLAALKPSIDLQAQGTAARISSLKSAYEGEQASERAARERLTLAQESLLRMEPVARKGFISTEAMRRRKEEVISLRESLESSKSKQEAITGQIAELSTEQQARPYSLVQQRGELLSQIARLKRERGTASGQKGFIIRATIDGVVTALQIRQGQIIDPRLALMMIAPAKQLVTVEIYIPSRAIGFVKRNQSVRIRYDAFPYQRFGAGAGHIQSVSLSVLRPEDVQAAVDIKEPVYRVIAALDNPWLDAYGQRYPVQSGMAVSADITLEHRTFGAWLLEPILALRGHL